MTLSPDRYGSNLPYSENKESVQVTVVGGGTGGGGGGGGLTQAETTAAVKAGVEAATNLDGIEGFVDNLETGISTLNSSIVTLQTFVDGLETGQSTLNSSIVTLQTFVDGLEALVNFSKGAGAVDSNTIKATIASDGVLMTRLGQNNVPATPTGSESAQLRWIGEALGPTQSAPTAYRGPITSNDVLAPPTVGTATAQTGGSLAASAHHIRVVGVNAYGQTTPVTPANSPVTPSASGAIRIPITVGSFTHFDIYLSTAADPLYIGRATAAQVTAGDTITAAASASANATFSGSGTPGNIEVRVVGTGLAASAAAQNTAYVIPGSPVDCSGKDFVYFDVEFSRTNSFASPSCVLIPAFLNATNSNTYFFGEAIAVSFGGGSGVVNPNRQRIRVEVGGSTGVALLVNNLSANTTVNIWQALR